MTAVTRSTSVSIGRLLIAWLSVGVPLAWGISATAQEAAALQLSNKLWLTLLPLLLGVGICVSFYYLDRSRFTVRGVVGPYFASVAILFALFSSLLAAELWQRQNKEDALLHVEMNGLKSILHIANSLDPDASEVRQAVRSYLEESAHTSRPEVHTAGGDQHSGEALQLLYRLAADPRTFKGNSATNAAFFNS